MADAILELPELVMEITSSSPCGSDMEYEADFMAMEQAAEAKAEQQFGDTVIEGEGADWKEVKKLALKCADTTRDVRVGTYLTRALLHTDGLRGFSEGIELVASYLSLYWDDVHPQLDADDDNDPTMRINALDPLIDRDATLKDLERAPIVMSKVVGKFSLRDMQMAEAAEMSTEEDEENSAPKMSVIMAAFQDVDLSQLQDSAAAVDNAIQHAEAIESTITEKVGAGRAISLSPLTSILKEIQKVLAEQLTRRGSGDVAGEEGEAIIGEDGQVIAGGSGPAGRLDGQVSSREDALRAIDMVIDYYKRSEPASPLPVLLGRAKRLANASFMELLKDLVPDSMHQMQVISGTDEEDD